MRIISKINGQAIHNNAGVSLSEIADLKTDHWARTSQALLQRLHNKYWFECDCTGYCENSPTLTIRSNPNKTYSIVNIPGRKQHDINCNLRYEKLTASTSIDCIEPFNITAPKNMRSLALIAQLLIERSSLETLDEQATYNENKDKLMSLGSKHITVNSSPLHSMLSFGFNSFYSVRKNPNTMGNFIIEVVDSIEECNGIVTLKNGYAQKHNFKLYRSITNIHIEHSDLVQLNGPFLVLSYICKNSKTRNKTTLAPYNALILPIASKLHWNTYNHPYFKDVLNGLINAKSWYKKNKKTSITITTPTRPITTTLGTCLPDFIIKLNTQTRIISLQQSKPEQLILNQLQNYDILSALGEVSEFNFDSVVNISDYIFKMNRKILSELSAGC